MAGTNPAKISATAVVAAGDVEEGEGVAEWAGSEDWEAKQVGRSPAMRAHVPAAAKGYDVCTVSYVHMGANYFFSIE